MCNCIEVVNSHLVKGPSPNTMLEYLVIGPKRVFVATCKRDDKLGGKPRRLFATYCPFCGEKYTPVEDGVSALIQSQ